MRVQLAVFVALSGTLSAQHLSAPAGVSGGHVTGAGTIEAQISTGDSFHGGISDTATVHHKPNYTGRLYDPKSVTVTATPITVPETTTRQLAANILLDDDTTLAIDESDITWSVDNGPLASISTSGLATAGAVYQDTPATARATWLGIEGTLTLTVTDTLPDNFGSYAGDGIDDDWQVGFFGLDNPDAAPGLDPDGDDQDNLLEFLALVDPTDPLSFFCTELSAKSAVSFSPVSPLRTYTLLASPDLNPGNFAPVTSTASDTAGERTLTHTSPPVGVRRFYKVEISN